MEGFTPFQDGKAPPWSRLSLVCWGLNEKAPCDGGHFQGITTSVPLEIKAGKGVLTWTKLKTKATSQLLEAGAQEQSWRCSHTKERLMVGIFKTSPSARDWIDLSDFQEYIFHACFALPLVHTLSASYSSSCFGCLHWLGKQASCVQPLNYFSILWNTYYNPHFSNYQSQKKRYFACPAIKVRNSVVLFYFSFYLKKIVQSIIEPIRHLLKNSLNKHS